MTIVGSVFEPILLLRSTTSTGATLIAHESKNNFSINTRIEVLCDADLWCIEWFIHDEWFSLEKFKGKEWDSRGFMFTSLLRLYWPQHRIRRTPTSLSSFPADFSLFVRYAKKLGRVLRDRKSYWARLVLVRENNNCFRVRTSVKQATTRLQKHRRWTRIAVDRCETRTHKDGSVSVVATRDRGGGGEASQFSSPQRKIYRRCNKDCNVSSLDCL